MDLVIDTSALIAVIANEPERETLVEHTIGAALLAPRSVHWEVGNAFSAMIRRGRISLGQAKKALGVYETIPIRFLEVELTRALTLAAEYDLYAYDAYLLTCAEQYRCALLSLDRGLIHAARQAGIEALEIES